MYKPLSKLFIALLVLSAFASCTNEVFLPTPQTRNQSVIEELQRTTWNPQNKLTNLKASQGKWRTITLSWDPVPGATRYDIYKSATPFGQYNQVSFSLSNSVDLSVPSGSALYLKVAAVNSTGETGELSLYVHGASLARPQISGIVEPSAGMENSAKVYWYMDNAEESAYQDKVRYRVSAFEKDTETLKSQIEVKDVFNAIIGGLNASTFYEFEVAAWLEEEGEGLRETSSRMDAATALRTHPGVPEDLITVPGSEAASISLRFKLPEKVEVQVGETINPVTGKKEKVYEAHRLYFEIKRRKSIDASFTVVKDLHIPDADYTPKADITWTDTTVERGVEYVYQIRSYTDDVDAKTASDIVEFETTWAMPKPNLDFGTLDYTVNDAGTQWATAQLPLVFTHDAKGVNYQYKLTEKVSPVGDVNANNADAPITYMDKSPISYAALSSHIAHFDLTGKTSSTLRGRGYYSYAVDVYLDAALVDTITTVGSKLVIENMEKIEVIGAAVADGYDNRFIITWKWEDERRYIIKSAPTADTPADLWATVGEYSGTDTITVTKSGDTLTLTVTAPSEELGNGITRYFSIQAYKDLLPGDTWVAPAAYTLGKAVISSGVFSYDSVDIEWPPVQKADAYVLKYQYQGESEKTGTSSPVLANGKLVYTLKPDGYNNSAYAGKQFSVWVEAKNTATGSITTSGVLSNTRIFGPYGMTVTATQNTFDASDNPITLTWTKVDGAAGYYVIRRQFNANNTEPTGDGFRYYVDTRTVDIKVKGKRVVGSSFDAADTDEVSGLPVSLPVAVSLSGDIFTLADKVFSDDDYDTKIAAKGTG
jgi:hypothetical protein